MAKGKYDYVSGFLRGLPFCDVYDFTDKTASVRSYIHYMLARTQSMFSYDGLPESIPQRMLELFLQSNGSVCIAEYDGVVYAFTGGMGGEPDVYYRPTKYIVANPALKMSKEYTIGEDCIVILSDSLYMGLLPMFSKYATQLVENDLSMVTVDIMARVVSLISAPDDRTKESAEKYIKDIYDGKLGIIAENAFFDGIKSQPISGASNNYLVPLIEYQQYIKASWLNDIGLNANFNMKREALNSSESGLNQDALLPLVDDMLQCRQRGVEQVNAMFGTNISVRLNSSWQDNQEEIEAEHMAILAEAGVSTEEPEPVSEVVETEEQEEVSTEEPVAEQEEEQVAEEEPVVQLLKDAVETIEEVIEDVGSPDDDG